MMDLLTLIAEIGTEAPEGQKHYFRAIQFGVQILFMIGLGGLTKDGRVLAAHTYSLMVLWVHESGIYSGFRGVGLSFVVQTLLAVVFVQYFKSEPRTWDKTEPELEPERTSSTNENS